jgi:transmembrane sensor
MNERNDIRARAADWVARRAAGLDPAAEAELRTWLAADPRHAAAWAELSAAWDQAQAPRRRGEGALLRERIAAHRRAARRRTILFSTTLAAAAAVAVMIGVRPRSATPASAVATAPAIALRPHVQTLPDGSTVELNAGAEIAVEFSPGRRGVRLVRGEALFAVAKSPARPFVVSAEGVEVRAVGTAFSVRLGAAAVDVVVTEGRVAVAPPASATLAAPTAPVLLDAGAKATVAASATFETAAAAPAVAQLSPAALARELDWRERRVEFPDVPLGEALAWFNRQNAVQLALAEPALARRRISGVYWTNDPAGFARLLEASLGFAVSRAGDTITLSQG